MAPADDWPHAEHALSCGGANSPEAIAVQRRRDDVTPAVRDDDRDVGAQLQQARLLRRIRWYGHFADIELRSWRSEFSKGWEFNPTARHMYWRSVGEPGLTRVGSDRKFIGFQWEDIRFTSSLSNYHHVLVVVVPHWAIALVTAILPAINVRRWSRRRRRPGLCPVCGYDLRATPDRCPECGKTVMKPQMNADERG
jgi:hypothetical protein